MSAGPFWHLFTPGKETPMIFCNPEDFRLAINCFLRTALEFPSARIIAYEFMNNHIHVVMSGQKEDILLFFSTFRKRLVRLFTTKGLNRNFSHFTPTVKPIENLRSIRNTIVYVARNGYVVNTDLTPFSYPWGTGQCYFNTPRRLTPCKSLGSRQLRDLMNCRNTSNLEQMQICNGHLAPESVCDIELGHAMFRDAHQYISLLTRNVEAYAEMAEEIGEISFLTDEELYRAAQAMMRKKFGATSVDMLSRMQKLEFCKDMHYSLKANNGQISRFMDVPRRDIDTLFPLSGNRQDKL